MNKLTRRLEELFIDMTFAEERGFHSEKEAVEKVAQAVEDTSTAIAFAEVGEFEPAASFINKDGDAPKSRRAGYPPGDLTSFAPAGLKILL